MAANHTRDVLAVACVCKTDEGGDEGPGDGIVVTAAEVSAFLRVDFDPSKSTVPSTDGGILSQSHWEGQCYIKLCSLGDMAVRKTLAVPGQAQIKGNELAGCACSYPQISHLCWAADGKHLVGVLKTTTVKFTPVLRSGQKRTSIAERASLTGKESQGSYNVKIWDKSLSLNKNYIVY